VVVFTADIEVTVADTADVAVVCVEIETAVAAMAASTASCTFSSVSLRA
jgi:hypothetical protein